MCGTWRSDLGLVQVSPDGREDGLSFGFISDVGEITQGQGDLSVIASDVKDRVHLFVVFGGSVDLDRGLLDGEEDGHPLFVDLKLVVEKHHKDHTIDLQTRQHSDQ